MASDDVTNIFKGVTAKVTAQAKNEINTMKEVMPLFVEYSKLQAEAKKAVYDSYIDAGFTPDQALELCKSEK